MMKDRELPVPSTRALRNLIIAVVLLLLLGSAWIVWAVARVQDENAHQDALIEQAERDRDALREANLAQDSTIRAQDQSIRKANERLEDAGKSPVTVPPAPDPIPGETGARGVRGFTGATGARGPRGFTGDQGPRGFGGPPGESIVGPAGEKGSPGDQGPAGAKGEKGDTGPAGARGDQGPAGEKGDTGPAGPAGEKGAPGDTGPAGPAGTALPGTYVCGDLEYLRGIVIGADGSVTLMCAPFPDIPGPPTP